LIQKLECYLILEALNLDTGFFGTCFSSWLIDTRVSLSKTFSETGFFNKKYDNNTYLQRCMLAAKWRVKLQSAC